MKNDPNEPVVVATAWTEAEAGIIASSLRERGIEARVFDAVGSVLSAFGPALNQPIQVVVRRSEAEHALATLRAIRQESIDIDWSQIDTGDQGPESSTKTGAGRSHRAWPVVLVGMGLALGCVPVGQAVLGNPIPGSTVSFVASLVAIVIGAPLILIGLAALLYRDE